MRSITIAAPMLLLGYGVARFLDGLNGTRHDGPAWTVGHVLFFAGIALFAVQATALAQRAREHRALASAALVPTYLGALCFLWVITGDLVAGFPELPGIAGGIGPVLFGIGMTTLLTVHAVARRLPYWCPAMPDRVLPRLLRKPPSSNLTSRSLL